MLGRQLSEAAISVFCICASQSAETELLRLQSLETRRGKVILQQLIPFMGHINSDHRYFPHAGSSVDSLHILKSGKRSAICVSLDERRDSKKRRQRVIPCLAPYQGSCFVQINVEQRLQRVNGGSLSTFTGSLRSALPSLQREASTGIILGRGSGAGRDRREKGFVGP